MNIPSCPMHKLRTDLPPLTDRIARLPVDERGYPVPFFVAWMDGRPEFRLSDPKKWLACYRDRLCWVCGQPLGVHFAFTIGPMCAINRTTAEPPEHRECAEWSVKGCPFLVKPQMHRREDEVTEQHKGNVDGIAILRNPGVIGIWCTTSYQLFKANGGRLIQIGEPDEVTWWRQGRPATKEEILHSIQTGLPALRELAERQDREEPGAGAVAELERRTQEVIALYCLGPNPAL